MDSTILDYTAVRPSARWRNWPVRLVAGIVFLNGLFAILAVLYSRLPSRVEMFFPFDYDLYGRFFGLFAGFLLIYFASQLLLRKRLAWWVAFVGSSIIVIGHAVYAQNLTALILPVLSLILLALFEHLFVVKYELHSVAQGTGLLSLSLLVALLYGSIGFTRLAPRDFTSPHHVGLAEGAKLTLGQFSLVDDPALSPHSHRAKWFITSLDLLGGLSIAFAFYSLFRPLVYRYATLPQERDRARDLITEYGTSSEDEFKLWPEDKTFFFNTEGTAMVAYCVDHGTAMVLGEPIGPVAAWGELIDSFKQFCHLHDWTVTHIYLPDDHLDIFEAAKLRVLKIGEDAVVDTATFATETVRSKHFRGVVNKFKRLGYSFEVANAPQSPKVLAEAAIVTKGWLSEGGRSERGFALGYHDKAYLRRNTLYLVRNDKGRLVAFANAIPSYNERQSTIDLMRYLPNTETGVMDYLLAEIILSLYEGGIAEFSLGLAPLAGVGNRPEQTLEERVIALAGRFGVGGFSYEGLRRFKNKFEPRWEPRFLVYERGAAGLTRTILAINSLMND
ncbi:DUF2156 domain-containing protein [Candidatus Saccharibacteria bacterium]|nr:DUF2156 domain-containing protein [Candidatus Saccharibacteria bacterium]